MGKKQARIDELQNKLDGETINRNNWQMLCHEAEVERNSLRRQLEAEKAKPFVDVVRQAAKDRHIKVLEGELNHLKNTELVVLDNYRTVAAKHGAPSPKELDSKIEELKTQLEQQAKSHWFEVQSQKLARAKQGEKHHQLNLEVGALQKQLREARNELTELKHGGFTTTPLSDYLTLNRQVGI